MATLIRIFGIVFVTWGIWQFVGPGWSIATLALYIVTFLIYHFYLAAKAANWECPEPYDYDTWVGKQETKWRDTHCTDERVYWYRIYRSNFPKNAKEWNEHRDNPYG